MSTLLSQRSVRPNPQAGYFYVDAAEELIFKHSQ